MISSAENKRKIINDPVHGFISIPTELIYDLIEHPFFQRLRRIKQLGLTNYVYPGATHTRFQHALGAVHLMSQAIDALRGKKIEITENEEEAALIAILLHDIGHGPFSHALEKTLIKDINHEDLSVTLMEKLNTEFDNKLDLALRIFRNDYSKKFLHQLVSSQLDMDRMDYLKRDSFYTGVTEGVIGTDRIIKMLNVHNDQLVLEAKGIYSIEKFLIARRLMYWQVYFHKTVVAAENLLVRTLTRAKQLELNGTELPASDSLRFFLEKDISHITFRKESESIINHFVNLDDSDIFVAAKQWQFQPDKILAELSKYLINRKLPSTDISSAKHSKDKVDTIKQCVMNYYKISEKEAEYFVFSEEISNYAYTDHDEKIFVLFRNGKVMDVSQASDVLNIAYLDKTVKKYFLCFPKNCRV